MKRMSLIGIGIFLLVCVGVPAVAQNQNIEMQAPMTTSVTGEIKVQIPFDFVVGNTDFSAGAYFLTQLNEKTLAVKSVDKRKSVVILTNSVSSIGTSTGPKLIFHRYGDRTFLAQTWSNYSETGHQVVVSSEEVKLARVYSQQQIALLIKK